MKRRGYYGRSMGGGALGVRLRRLAERIDRDVAKVYEERGVAFEQRWFGVLNQVALNGPMSVSEIAAALRITHVSISQASGSLERAGYVSPRPDPEDGRRRVLTLTESGRALVKELGPLWRALERVAEQLNDEAGDVVALLNRLEDALDERTLRERLRMLASQQDGR